MLDYFCAQESRDAGAPLTATAQRVDAWLLLEVAEPWGRQAFEECGIPVAVRAYVSAQAAAIPNSRIQLIKRAATGPAGARFVAALSREQSPVSYAFDLGAIEDLLALDIAGIVAGQPEYAAYRLHEPLYLVCTNSRRDRCCAARGLPVYTALAGRVGAAAWQTSHVGGHRYAANVVVLPYGVYYGYLDDHDLDKLVESVRWGNVYLPAYRGRSCYPPEVQAAETFLREQTGERRLDRFRLDAAVSTGSDRWLIRFASLGDGMTHEMALVAAPSSYHVHASCGDENAEPVTVYRLTDYRLLNR